MSSSTISYIFFWSHLIFKNIDQVHPVSFSIDGMLGNMRFCDMSLGPDHRWGWLCDIRKPGVESLIKVSSTSQLFLSNMLANRKDLFLPCI